MDPSRNAPRDAPDRVAPPAEARQRWRLAWRRSAEAASMLSKDAFSGWESGLAASGLPIAGLDLPTPRPKVVFGAPLPVGVPAERELLDLFLVIRTPVAEVRAAIESALVPGHAIVDLHDVWLGEAPLSGQVAAADYRVVVRSADATALERARLVEACAGLVAARTLPRTREKGGRAVEYDLRPLVASVTVEGINLDGRASLRIRTRFDPERGVGRPEEVVAALGQQVDLNLEVVEIVRVRLLLAGDE